MKAAISVPDDTFAEVEHRAAELGMSRSEFFSRAARRYLDQLEAESLTRQMDEALALQGGEDDSVPFVRTAGRSLLDADDW